MRAERWGELTVRITGGTDGYGGGDGPAVVLLHGWAAPGDDLVPLGGVIDAPPGTRFLFPEGPLAVDLGLGDARAWWAINVDRLNEDIAAGRPRNLSREVPPGLADARRRLLALLDELPRQLGVGPDRTVLGGFSQGAMLACDVTFRSSRPVAGLVVLSGTVLARDEWLSAMPSRKGLPVLQTHGRADGVLPFFLAEQLREFMTEAGLAVEWLGFEGGHEIPEQGLTRLGGFLRSVLSS